MKTRIAVLILDGFLAVTALWGALLVVPQLPASLLRSGPFADFTIPAFGLGVIGILAAVGAVAVFWRPPVAAIASILAGGAIIVFEIVEAIAVGSLLKAPSELNDQGYVAVWLQPLYAIVGMGIVWLAFFGIYRPWQLRWGATDDEVKSELPGDHIVRHPVFDATRAVTVNARPQDIWPWIVQLGFNRAGWYTYDLLDNFGRRSAERIVPELQHLDVGDVVPLGPGKDAGPRVLEVEPARWTVWGDKTGQQASWTWVLSPRHDGSTRLLTRVRAPVSWRKPLTAVWLLLFEFADFPMMRKCMLGIKRRAEALQRSSAANQVMGAQ